MNDETARALETLTYPFTTGALPLPEKGVGPVLYLNALPHPALHPLREALTCLQMFKPYAESLVQAGYQGPYTSWALDLTAQSVFILIPKQQKEAEALLAQGLHPLKEGGLVVCAADNKAGGPRLEKMLSAFGVTRLQNLSKHKARVVWGYKGPVPPEKLTQARKAGEYRIVPQTGFWSCPGLFGWDKIDTGSKLLLQNLPETLSGRVADFGCGYGYLSQFLLQQKNITALSCIDADFRALETCKRNLEGKNCNMTVSYLWEDLRHSVTALKGLDHIVMNPPFHEGKGESQRIGQAFIRTAARSLHPSGHLWMVANVHLSYEALLQDLFKTVRKCHEGQGFKVYHASHPV